MHVHSWAVLNWVGWEQSGTQRGKLHRRMGVEGDYLIGLPGLLSLSIQALRHVLSLGFCSLCISATSQNKYVSNFTYEAHSLPEDPQQYYILWGLFWFPLLSDFFFISGSKAMVTLCMLIWRWDTEAPQQNEAKIVTVHKETFSTLKTFRYTNRCKLTNKIPIRSVKILKVMTFPNAECSPLPAIM